MADTQEILPATRAQDTQVTGNVGLYYCCYELSRRGWNVMPTARNARGIDIIAYRDNGHEFRGIQVKTLSKKYAVPLGSSLDKVMGDFWVVIRTDGDRPRAFVLTPEEVRAGAHRNVKDGRESYWLEPRDYEKDVYQDEWERISGRLPPTPAT